MLTAIETTGTVNGEHGLVLDESLPFDEKSRVRVIVFFDEKKNGDLDELEWLKSASENEAFEFLVDEEEDIYTLADGKPL